MKAPRSTKKRSEPAGPAVLLVENDRSAFDRTAGIIRGAGYAVVHATTAVDALDILRTPRPVDLLVASVAMPGQPSGFVIARMARLRRIGLPVLFLSAGEPLDGKEADRAVGPVLERPFTPDALLEQLRHLTGDPLPDDAPPAGEGRH